MTDALRVSREQAELFSLLERGRFDPAFFQEQILGIAANPAQKRWYAFIAPGTSGWEWRYKLVIHVAANQIGKSLGVATLIIWAATYKIGVPHQDYAKWFASAYLWVHVAPKQAQAYIPLKDIRLILKGAHVAQDKGEKLFGLKFRLPPGWARDVKVETYYEGLEFWNGAVVQFRTSEDKAQALQGLRAHGISFDEVGFEDHLKAVVHETLFMRLISTGGPLFMVGTPNGLTEYYEFVRDVIDKGSQIGDRSWEAGDQALCWSHISDNVGYGVTQDEVERMEANLDPETKEQQLRGAFLEPAEAFFVPSGKIVKAFRKDLPEEQLPIAGHKYVIMWDPSVASDPTAVIVIDVSTVPWRGVYMRHYLKPPAFTQLLSDMHALHASYNGARARGGAKSYAITGYDATSMGGSIIRQQLAGLSPQRPINFAGSQQKLQALTDLRAALVQGRLIFPTGGPWLRLQRELLNYRLKDDKIAQDAVSAAAGAAHIAAKGFSGAQKASFRVYGRRVPNLR